MCIFMRIFVFWRRAVFAILSILANFVENGIFLCKKHSGILSYFGEKGPKMEIYPRYLPRGTFLKSRFLGNLYDHLCMKLDNLWKLGHFWDLTEKIGKMCGQICALDFEIWGFWSPGYFVFLGTFMCKHRYNANNPYFWYFWWFWCILLLYM